MSTTQPIIKLRDVSRIYRTDTIETAALSGVNLSIDAGEFVCVSGPSGCGKSTLLSILGLLDQPTTGDYVLNGQHTGSLSLRAAAQLRNRQLGFVFQSFNLIGDLTVAENVELPLRYRGADAAVRQNRTREALELVGLMHRANHYPAQLSGGQQQRVAVARAIAGDPILLLADEPTGNLDSASGESVMQLLVDLHESGSTIVMVTHDPRYALMADRQFDLLDGTIRADLPAGATVADVQIQDGTMMVRLALPDGGAQIMVFRLSDGRQTGTIELQPQR